MKVLWWESFDHLRNGKRREVEGEGHVEQRGPWTPGLRGPGGGTQLLLEHPLE